MHIGEHCQREAVSIRCITAGVGHAIEARTERHP